MLVEQFQQQQDQKHEHQVIEDSITSVTTGYLKAVAPGIAFITIFTCLRCYSEGMTLTKPIFSLLIDAFIKVKKIVIIRINLLKYLIKM